jgi:hypothetical protein
MRQLIARREGAGVALDGEEQRGDLTDASHGMGK